MMEEQYCKKCKNTKSIKEFYEGNRCCKKCIDYNKNCHYNNNDRYNEAQRKIYEDDEEYRKKSGTKTQF